MGSRSIASPSLTFARNVCSGRRKSTLIEWQGQLDPGEIESQAAIVRREGLIRVCHIMSLLRLAPRLQQRVLSTGSSTTSAGLCDHTLRPIVRLCNGSRQTVLLQKGSHNVIPTASLPVWHSWLVQPCDATVQRTARQSAGVQRTVAMAMRGEYTVRGVLCPTRFSGK